MAAEKTFPRPLNSLRTALVSGLRAFGLGVLHSAMAPCGPLYSLRTTPPGQRLYKQRW